MASVEARDETGAKQVTRLFGFHDELVCGASGVTEEIKALNLFFNK